MVYNPNHKNDLFIGSLGGTLYPLNFPKPEEDSYLNAFFYSPSTRLLISGNYNASSLYCTVLPVPEPKMLVQKITAQNVTNISWNMQDDGWRLEKSANLASWETVSEPRINEGVRTQVTVTDTPTKLFFRLAYP
jgi:hypothetical protein